MIDPPRTTQTTEEIPEIRRQVPDPLAPVCAACKAMAGS